MVVMAIPPCFFEANVIIFIVIDLLLSVQELLVEGIWDLEQSKQWFLGEIWNEWCHRQTICLVACELGCIFEA